MSSSMLDMSLDEIIKNDDGAKKTQRSRNRRGGQNRRGGRRGGQGRRNVKRQGRGYGSVRRRRSNNRLNPYHHIAGQSIEDIALGAPENRVLKVSQDSPPKKTAGAIAQCVRIGGAPPAIMCTGTYAINQAIKAIAIARRYLEDETQGESTDLLAQPQFSGQTEHLVIRLRKCQPIDMDMEVSELTAKPTGDPRKIAGAIAGKIRDGERVGITAIGPEAVMVAVEAIAVSRRYLKDDRVDIKFAPMFEKVETDDRGEMNAIHFSILSRRMN